MTGQESVDRHDEAGETFFIVSIAIHLVTVEAVHRRKVEMDAIPIKVEDATALGSSSHTEIVLIEEAVQDFRMLRSNLLIKRKDDRDIFA